MLVDPVRIVWVGERVMTPTAKGARAWLRGGALVMGLAAVGGAAVLVAGGESLEMGQTQKAVEAAYATFKGLQQGNNANDVPLLGQVDPTLFGIALVTTDGKLVTAGDVGSEVSLQSIAHLFTLAHLMEASGDAAIRDAMGPDGPAGSIVVSRLLLGASARDPWTAIVGTYSAFAGRRLVVDPRLYARRPAGDGDPARDLDLRQRAVAVNAIDLATMAATLANGGVNPRTGATVLASRRVGAVLAVMAMAGLAGASGQWLYETGLPAKSGAGGAILAVCPGRFGIAAISPPLDGAGNSVRAQKAIAYVAGALQANPYAARPLSAQR
jgi:glutaminase